MKFKDYTKKVKCKECKNIFKGNEALKTKFGDCFSAPFASIIFVDTKGVMFSGSPRADEFVLACPKCKQTHLFGFEDA